MAAIISKRYKETITNAYAHCRSIPGDPSWPSDNIWASLNSTVNGRLIASIPIASPCHRSLNGRTNPLFDEYECAALRENWFSPETHLPSSSSPMAYPFSNNSCNPFLDSTTPCTLDSHPIYTINATNSRHFQAAVRFARDHNVRLVIRNTGHDYMGKSTGAHSLSVWTHYMKSIELVKYQSPQYTGPGIKMGAGVEIIEAIRFASSHGLIVVGGDTPTVGFAGGFTQGGGHGPLASKYGLSADQVLEWEVVTGAGEIVTATATQNIDLFWALRGGGGGTFGIVSSLTVKAFPDTLTSMVTTTILNNGSNLDNLYSAITTFIRDTLPGLVDAGAFVIWIAAPFGFMVSPAIAPGLALADLDDLFRPFIIRLSDMGLEHQYSQTQYSTFLESYKALQRILSWNVSDYNIGSRLIPRDVATQNTEALVEAIRRISSQTLIGAVSYNLTHGISQDEVAVNPYIRKALFSLTIGTPINYTDWTTTISAQNKITYDFLPLLERLTPKGAAYLNEADFQQPDFQRTIYGDNYERLRNIKRKYDPYDMFYARTAVGSEEWVEDEQGRLCKSTI
ncbi:hypothetical protein F5Y01DRAFT_302953 [Xylaria sp. FL0043]|nr:hypothetical protein F5Y01DRAFT_302953 [Xylaria sp. FL0043]